MGVLSLIATYFIAKNLKWKDPKLVVLILATDAGFLQFSNLGRMESLALILTLSSILSVTSKFYFASGFFIGLATITHPISVIHIPIILFIMNYDHSVWKSYLNFIIGGLPLVAIWCIYIYPDLNLFLYQFGLQLNRKKELFDVFGIIARLQTLFSTYVFTKYRIVLIGMGFLIFLWEGFISGWNSRYKISLFYFITIFFCLFLTSEFYYTLYLTVPISLMLGLMFGSFNRLVYVYLGFLISFQIGYMFYLTKESNKGNGWKTTWQEHNSKIQSLVSKDKTIYLQHIPELYFNMNQEYSKIKVFVPGELAIDPLSYREIVCESDSIIISDSLLNSDRTKACDLMNSKKYEYKIIIDEYQSKVFPNLKSHIFIKK